MAHVSSSTPETRGDLKRYMRMARKTPLGRRLRYWFDNTMSRGTPSLIG